VTRHLIRVVFAVRWDDQMLDEAVLRFTRAGAIGAPLGSGFLAGVSVRVRLPILGSSTLRLGRRRVTGAGV